MQMSVIATTSALQMSEKNFKPQNHAECLQEQNLAQRLQVLTLSRDQKISTGAYVLTESSEQLDSPEFSFLDHSDSSDDEFLDIADEVTLHESESTCEVLVESFKDSALRPLSASDFEPVRVLGKGSFGKVFLVKQRSSGKLFAQKTLKKASIIVRRKLIEYTKSERLILEHARHPFICQLHYAFQDKNKLYLILQYAQGGELFQLLANEKMLSEKHASFYAAELILALSHLHELGIVYRDLKPENCLLDSHGHILLTDFGLSKVRSSDSQPTTFVGTCEYMAPETIMEKPYSFEVDWWALGVLIYDLLTGSPPFTGNSNKKVMDKILKKPIIYPYYLSLDAKDILHRFLKKSPQHRLGAQGLRDQPIIRSHRFFRRLDWHKLEKRELTPPILPTVSDPELAENFSSEFTSLPLNSMDEHEIIDDLPPGASFNGFSFVASPMF